MRRTGKTVRRDAHDRSREVTATPSRIRVGGNADSSRLDANESSQTPAAPASPCVAPNVPEDGSYVGRLAHVTSSPHAGRFRSASRPPPPPVRQMDFAVSLNCSYALKVRGRATPLRFARY